MTPDATILMGTAADFIATRVVGHLATAGADGRPHVVPVCYAWDGEELWVALDAKPKRSDDLMRLRRVRNIREQPDVTLIVDDYVENAWGELAYVAVHGVARIVMPEDLAHGPAIALLRARYAPYQTMPIEMNPAIAIRPTRVVTWGAVAPRATRSASFETAITGRRSVRRFTSEPIEREAITRILDAARWAPSPHGRQPWRFAVVTAQTTRDRLTEAMGDEWRATLAQDGESEEVVNQRLTISRERIRTAPAIIVPCLYLEDLDRYPDGARQEAETTMAVQSIGAAIQNMLLTAYHEGLDMGWMCAPLFCQAIVQSALELPASWLPHALLPLGHAAAEPKRRPRRPLSDLVRWDV